MNHSRSIWSQTSVIARVTVILIAVVVFAIIFFLEYAYGNKRGDLLGSMLYSFSLPIFLALGLLNLSAGLARMRAEQLVWYKEWHIVQGIANVLFSLFLLVFLGLANNVIYEPVGLALDGTFAFFMLVCTCWSLVVSRQTTRSS